MPETIAPPAMPTTAAKPSAPSPTPKAASPSPKAGDAAPDVIGSAESNDPFKDAFAEIDREAGEETERDDKRNRPGKSSLEDKSKANGDAKPSDAKPKDDEPKTPKELRDVYNALKEKVSKEYEPQVKELSTLRAKVKELESRDETETTSTRAEIEAVKKRNAELERHMKFVDYKQSKEYKELETTLNDAWSGAMRKLGGISISRMDTESGETVERELTVDDLARYARLDPKLLWKELKQEIPDAAERTTVINHVQKIQDLSDSVFKAEEKAKAEADTHAKTQTETQRQFAARREKLWKETNAALAEKYPKWFGRDDADPEGNAVFDKGKAFSDLVFSPGELTPERIELLPKMFREAIESRQPFPPEALVRLQAIAANKLANHDRAISKLKAANTRISELEKSLKQYEESGPDAITIGRGRRVNDGPLTADEEFDAIAR
jgi:hypothetical protein